MHRTTEPAAERRIVGRDGAVRERDLGAAIVAQPSGREQQLGHASGGQAQTGGVSKMA